VIRRCLDEGVAVDVKLAENHLAIGGKQGARSIGRFVVADEVAIDERIVVPEEVREHALLVPAQGMEMNSNPGAEPPRQKKTKHAAG
jgi:hypothetical protein